jgi:hypothetical protein
MPAYRHDWLMMCACPASGQHMRVTNGQSGGPLRVVNLFQALPTFASMPLSPSITKAEKHVCCIACSLIARKGQDMLLDNFQAQISIQKHNLLAAT